MDIQALFDGMSAQWQKERAATQMTLGKMIAALEQLPPDKLIDGVANPHSYRGYYSDLAFEPTDEKVTAADALAMCKETMGKAFAGYKGGGYVMGELTPVFLAHCGITGPRIMGIGEDGAILTAEED